MKKFGKALLLTLILAIGAFALAACGSEKPVNYDGTYMRTAEDGYYYLVIKDDTMTAYFADENDFSQAVALKDGKFKLTGRTDETVTAVNETVGYTNVYSVTSTNDGLTLKLDAEDYQYVKQF